MRIDESRPRPFTRRDFIAGSSLATVMTLLGGVRLTAAETGSDEPSAYTGPTVKLGVIGLGPWGREILSNLGRLPRAEVVSICDHYPAYLRRGGRLAPDAAREENYQSVLESPDIQAVVIATPTHQHRDIALAALEAGKHVYCEAPLAHTVEDARTIALAANAARAQVFQSGLQFRADKQRHFLLPFIRSGALGSWVLARLQHFTKDSWRRASSNPEREKEINWRLEASLSLGLVGEIGIHQIDQVGWFMDRHPSAVSGDGTIRLWDDGRTVPDTAHAHIEFPESATAYFDATLASSYCGESETYHGSYATVLMRESSTRGSSAWMFKEVDSPLLGWEVYATKEQFHEDTGIVLKMGGSKQKELGSSEHVSDEPVKTPLYHSLDAFLTNCSAVDVAKRDFIDLFGGDDPDAVADHAAGVKRVPTGTAEDGFRATVVAIKANEAVTGRKRIILEDEWFELS